MKRHAAHIARGWRRRLAAAFTALLFLTMLLLSGHLLGRSRHVVNLYVDCTGDFIGDGANFSYFEN